MPYKWEVVTKKFLFKKQIYDKNYPLDSAYIYRLKTYINFIILNRRKMNFVQELCYFENYFKQFYDFYFRLNNIKSITDGETTHFNYFIQSNF